MLELKVHDGDTVIVLQFEHSLLSLSKWEEKHKVAFLASVNKRADEMIDYFQEMLLTPVDRSVVYRLSPEQLDELNKYVNDVRTASSVPKTGKGRGPSEVTTSELIYYWMTALEIDWRAETWHLSRLMMLIQITNYKKQPEKQRSQAEAYQNWNELNERNKQLFGTDG